MLVGELRQRLNEKVGQVAASGDQEEIATIMEYVRAVLIALARQPNDVEFDLPNAVVDTKTAALILGVHPEHLRYIIRRKQLPAVKENGEYRIALPDIVDFMVATVRGMSTLINRSTMLKSLLESKTMTLWERPAEGSG